MVGRSRAIRPKTIDLNLVPPELWQPFISTGVVVLVAAILLGGMLFMLIDSARVSIWTLSMELEEQLTTTNSMVKSEVARIEAERIELAKLEREIKRLKEDITRYSTKPTLQARRSIVLTPAVDAVLASQPAGLRLTSLSWQEPRLELQGKAANIQQVLSYAQQLRDSKLFFQVDLRSVNLPALPASAGSASNYELTFTLNLELASEAVR